MCIRDSSRILLRLLTWALPLVARESYWQAPARLLVAEKDMRQRRPGGIARQPHLKDTRYPVEPGHADGAAGLQNDDCARIGRGYRFDQRVLIARQIRALARHALTDLVPDDEIRAILSKHGKDIEHAAKDLVAAANSAGGTDNITVGLALVE